LQEVTIDDELGCCNNATKKTIWKKRYMNSTCCEKVVGKAHHIVVIASPLPKTRIPVLLWFGSCYCYSSSPNSFSLLMHIVAIWQSSTMPSRLPMLLNIHHYFLKPSNLHVTCKTPNVFIINYFLCFLVWEIGYKFHGLSNYIIEELLSNGKLPC
jgi:hypothetical protein